MGNHRAQASKNSVTAKQEVKSSLSNVRRSLSGLPENHLSKSIFDTHDKPVAVSQASGFFNYGSIPIFPKGKTPVRLNSQQAVPIQAKLKIGQPNDKYEQEADRVAEQVMRMPDPKIQQTSQADTRYSGIKSGFSASNADVPVQRQQEKEEELIQAKPLAQQISPLIQRQPDEEVDEELIQAKLTGEGTPAVTPAISAGIQSLQGGGRPLSKAERSFFEPRFGADFSGVRVHSDARAAGLARSVNARAFTHGRDVVFGAGEYSSGSLVGRRLLAHELVHVVRQGGGQLSQAATSLGNDMVLKKPIESDPNDALSTDDVSDFERLRQQIRGENPSTERPLLTGPPSQADINAANSIIDRHYRVDKEAYDIWSTNFQARLDIVTSLSALQDKSIGVDIAIGILEHVVLAGVGAAATKFFTKFTAKLSEKVREELVDLAKATTGAVKSGIEGGGEEPADAAAKFKVQEIDNFLDQYNVMKANIINEWTAANAVIDAAGKGNYHGKPGALPRLVRKVFGPVPKLEPSELNKVSKQIELAIWKRYAQKNWRYVITEGRMGVYFRKVTGYNSKQRNRIKSEFKIDVEGVGTLWNLPIRHSKILEQGRML